jgi:hypothetical protein
MLVAGGWWLVAGQFCLEIQNGYLYCMGYMVLAFGDFNHWCWTKYLAQCGSQAGSRRDAW